jgi:hypothetical protein
MKRFFIIAFLSAISQFVVGQKEMAKVGLIPDFSSSDFQLFSFRDTMFLFCEYQMNNAFGSEMILPDGNLVSLPMRHLNQYSICGMTTYGSVKTFYTLKEKRKKIVVTSNNLDIKKNQGSNEVRDTITGSLLGVSNYNNQMVFFFL